MFMKKFIVFVGFLALVSLVSCSQDVTVETPEVDTVSTVEVVEQDPVVVQDEEDSNEVVTEENASVSADMEDDMMMQMEELPVPTDSPMTIENDVTAQ